MKSQAIKFLGNCSALVFVLLALLSLSALVGCTRDDEGSSSGSKNLAGQPITFRIGGSGVGTQTKSSDGGSASSASSASASELASSFEGQTYQLYYDFAKGENVPAPVERSSAADGLSESSDAKFSGEVVSISTGLAERIDWEVGDQITIAHYFEPEGLHPAAAIYKINSVDKSSDGSRSIGGTLVPVGAPLLWNDNDQADRFAAFPVVGYGMLWTGFVYDGGWSKTLGLVHTTQGGHDAVDVIPSVQYCTKSEDRNYKSPTTLPTYPQGRPETWYAPNMKYAHMIAHKFVPAGPHTEGLSLEFHPHFSSVEVKLVKPSDLTGSVELVSAKLTAGSGLLTSPMLIGNPLITLRTDRASFIAQDFLTTPPEGDNAPYYVSPAGCLYTYGATSVETGNEITMFFKKADGTPDKPVLDADKPTSFTFLLFPATDVTQLELTLELEINGGTETKVMKLQTVDAGLNKQWIPLPAGKKLTISNMTTWPDSNPDYILQIPDVINVYANGWDNNHQYNSESFNYYSYRRVGGQNLLNVTAKYSLSKDGPWFSQNDSNMPDDLKELIYHYGSVRANIFRTRHLEEGYFVASINVNKNPVTPTLGSDNRTTRAATLRSRGTNGFTEEAPQDLSLTDPLTGNLRTGEAALPQTANCYIIQKGGWYMFPCVYGNAIDYKEAPTPPYWNTQAYAPAMPSSVNSSTFLTPFRSNMTPFCHNRQSNGNVEQFIKNYEAVIIWQDVALGEQFLTIPAEVWNSQPVGRISGKGMHKAELVGTSGEVPYVRFYIDPNKIQEGNVLIGVREASSGADRYVIWSWHIWISAENLTVQQVNMSESNTEPNQLLSVPLGWNKEAEFIYPERQFYVQFTQTSDKKKKVALVRQHGGEAYAEIRGTLTYYQWGRKDPFIGVVDSHGSDYGYVTPANKTWSSPGNYTMEGSDNRSVPYLDATTNTPELSISKPNYMYGYYNESASGTFDDPKISGYYTLAHANLWDATRTYSTVADRVPVKTIFDPCPPGFSVPRRNFLTGLLTEGKTYISANHDAKRYMNIIWTKSSDLGGRGGIWVKRFSGDTEGYFIPCVTASFRNTGGKAEKTFGMDYLSAYASNIAPAGIYLKGGEGAAILANTQSVSLGVSGNRRCAAAIIPAKN